MRVCPNVLQSNVKGNVDKSESYSEHSLSHSSPLVEQVSYGSMAIPLHRYITGQVPSMPSGGALGQAVNFKVPLNLLGGTFPTYGTLSFDDSQGNWRGGGTVATGLVTTGPIYTGYTWWMFFNGTTGWYPNSWQVNVPAVNGIQQPSNYFVTISGPNGAVFQVDPIAGAYADNMISSSGALSGAVRGNAGAIVNPNDTVTHGQWYTYTYTVTETTPFAARLSAYFNPAYPTTPASQAFIYFITNSTNVQVQGATSILSHRIPFGLSRSR